MRSVIRRAGAASRDRLHLGFVFTGVAPGEYTLVATGMAQRGAPPPSGADQPVTPWNVTDLVVDGNDGTICRCA
jgi:hypothetical protein